MTGLESTFGKLLSDMANMVSDAAIQSDPVLAQRLHALDGRCIEFNCTLPVITSHLLITRGRMIVQPGNAPHPQVIVKGSGADMLGLIGPGDTPLGLQIEGDDTALLEVVELLRSFRPDLAQNLPQPLTDLFGASTAQTLTGSAEMALRGVQSLLQGLGQSMQNQAASRFVHDRELDELLDGIDQLRLRVDRLAARIDAYESTTHPDASGSAQ